MEATHFQGVKIKEMHVLFVNYGRKIEAQHQGLTAVQ
jgi:hypothetical protein